MITVTNFNPAVDRSIILPSLLQGQVQRALKVRVTPGGKGLHVAQTIAALGEPVQLVSAVDAIHRNLFERHLTARGVNFQCVEIKRAVRMCHAMLEQDGRTTEILEPGPRYDDVDRDAVLRRFHDCLDGSVAVVLSGSLPEGFADETYACLVRDLDQDRCPCFVDTSDMPLHRAVDAGPFLLKPNRDEAMALTGCPLDSLSDAAVMVRDLHARGVRCPVVTLGERGAVGYDGQRVWHAVLDLERIHNAVGSGDCLLAGMVVGWLRTGEISEALRLGVACGGANALNEETGYVERGTVDALVPKVRLAALDE